MHSRKGGQAEVPAWTWREQMKYPPDSKLYAPPHVLQRDLDKYRSKSKQQQHELASLVAQLKECRAKYLALQETHDATVRRMFGG